MAPADLRLPLQNEALNARAVQDQFLKIRNNY